MLELKNLYKKYLRKDSWAVRDLSLRVNRGELLALVGESGSGKTTLLRLIAGFELPEEGEIYLNQQRVFGQGTFVQPEKRRIGMVFQDYALFPHLNVGQNIAFGLQKCSGEQRDRRLQELLELVGLQTQAHKFPHQLSGGQQQRVALARALAPRPDILLLDEPFSNLDEVLKEQMRREMRRIIKESDITALFVTHDTRDALTTADRIIVLKEGSIHQAGSPQQVYEQPGNAYVAGFFGHVNLLPATAGPQGYLTPLGLINCHPAAQAAERIQLCIRPEHIVPCAAQQALFTGRVEEVVYLGSQQRVHLQTEAGLLIAHLDALEKVTPGQLLPCRIKVAHITPIAS
ncbi:ABC transporter ATP-binding protein [Cesiribacter andamanensis]|uniref:Fe(3+) ions import ATP-binding protein FbpC 2 n=1 Tax=Cesiribacter andamanensis AMV16 TaxID=1279009 RepID=M7N5B3_9BACT|nr:ABC transporter ATP-binding protein [Cesiribacter andamanensis]EMR02416.1 Fe(3+) ions import ATP-binding protein FbpC 2 [Cesiribacter andamanensis AMV16]